MIEKEFYEKVYDVLIELGRANESTRSQFVWLHSEPEQEYLIEEYRFSGKLGFGGKYWRLRNEVNCYPEDETKERHKLIQKINERLKLLKNE